MSIFESLTLALSNLRTNKMRSALTLLGVIIGIASVITILTIGDGLREDTLSSLNNDGGVEIVAEARPIPTEEELQQAGGEEYYYYSGRLDDPSYEITSDDIDRIKDLLGDKLAGVSIGGNSSYSGDLIYDSKTINGSTFFVNPYYFVQNNSQIEVGHGLTQDDIDNNKPVAVLNNKLAKQIFGDNIQATAVTSSMIVKPSTAPPSSSTPTTSSKITPKSKWGMASPKTTSTITNLSRCSTINLPNKYSVTISKPPSAKK